MMDRNGVITKQFAAFVWPLIDRLRLVGLSDKEIAAALIGAGSGLIAKQYGAPTAAGYLHGFAEYVRTDDEGKVLPLL